MKFGGYPIFWHTQHIPTCFCSILLSILKRGMMRTPLKRGCVENPGPHFIHTAHFASIGFNPAVCLGYPNGIPRMLYTFQHLLGMMTHSWFKICISASHAMGWIPSFGGMMSPWDGGKLNPKCHLQNPHACWLYLKLKKKGTTGIFMGSITRSWGFINPATGHPVKNRWFRFALIIVFCWTLNHFLGGHLTGGWMNHHS